MHVHMQWYITGPAIPIVLLSAGILHDDYGIYDDNQRIVLVTHITIATCIM